MSRDSRTVAVVACLVLGGAVVLGGCGSDGSSPDAGPTRTASRPTPSPSLSRPTVARPSGSPGLPSPSGGGEPSTPGATVTRTATVGPPSSSQQNPPPATASASGSDEVTVTEEDSSDVTDWWPLALLALVVLLALGAWAWVRHSRRARWDGELSTQSAECRWVATTLAPALVTRTTPVSAVAAQWVEGQRRIDNAHLALAQLTTTAPTTDREARAESLSGALDDLRQALSADIALRTVTTGDPSTDFGLVTSLQAVERSRQALVSALVPEPTPA